MQLKVATETNIAILVATLTSMLRLNPMNITNRDIMRFIIPPSKIPNNNLLLSKNINRQISKTIIIKDKTPIIFSPHVVNRFYGYFNVTINILLYGVIMKKRSFLFEGTPIVQ
ncbi:hypothetical protein [Radiobacillus sp. PE A8.2]|uniref:hypothetical protein n=1 Tax=Radiobacillus sp. PE A8.2 TaxID=3380349 RepID=UPI0038908BFC